MNHLKIKSNLLLCFFLLTCSNILVGNSTFENKSQVTASILADEKYEEISVTFVGNAGYLVTVGDKKILIDALFKGFAGNYNLPKDIQEKLTLAKSPFDGVDLIITTHWHDDHFNPDMVELHLKNNPKAVFVSTKQAVGILNDFSERTISFNPVIGKSEKKEINGFSIEAIYLPHGDPSTTKVVNLGFIVSVNGVKFFHTGDINYDYIGFDEIRKYKLPEQNIDFAFIQHFYLTGDPSEQKLVNEGVGSKYIIPSHYHFTNPPLDTSLVRRNYPQAIIFKEELQKWVMPLAEEEFPVLKGDYLGQPLPGETPVVFARGIISTDHLEHSALIFSPNGNEVFWSLVQRPAVKGVKGKVAMTMKRVDDRLTVPTEAKVLPAFTLHGIQHFLWPELSLSKNPRRYLICPVRTDF